MNSVLLQTPIAYLKTVGPTRAKLLKEQLGIHTYQDLLHFFPNRYVDRTQFHHINQLEASQAEVQIVGVITQIETITQKKGSRLVAKFLDNTGAMELVWFKGAKWIKESIKTNTPYVIFGKISVFQGRFNMAHPDMELLENYQANNRMGLQAIYPSTEKPFIQVQKDFPMRIWATGLCSELWNNSLTSVVVLLRKPFPLVF